MNMERLWPAAIVSIILVACLFAAPQAVAFSSENTNLIWDAEAKTTNVIAGASEAHLTFSFTNVTVNNVTITHVHASCGCTTAQLPQLPWVIPPGTNGQIGVTVNLAFKSGVLFKTLTVDTDKGSKELAVNITILPPVSSATNGTSKSPVDPDRERSLQIGKVDRQAVFKGNCATCHLPDTSNKYGKVLYDSVCGICHDDPDRATMVPNLHSLGEATDEAFWRKWIEHGKTGSLMPAFSATEGGPLTDVQIMTLASYLNEAIPSHH